jgi:hypothetical protein
MKPRNEIDGFWTVEFASTEGIFGGAVAVFEDGKIVGGDSGYTFIGTYEVDAISGPSKLNAKFRVEPFIPDFLSIFRTANIVFNVVITGNYATNSIVGQGSPIELPDTRFSVKLTRKEMQ